jgi:hypothetical protein
VLELRYATSPIRREGAMMAVSVRTRTTMKYYFDTEFYEHDDRVEPISIGIVSQDGREFYAEVASVFDVTHMTPWLAKNVAPNMSGDVQTIAQVRQGIINFVDSDSDPEFWAFWGAYDWVVLCQLFGGMLKLPKRWVYKLKEFADLKIRIPEFAGQHNALADARAMYQAVSLAGVTEAGASAK